MNHLDRNDDDLQTILDRRVYSAALCGWVDPITGQTWPDIRGGATDDGNRDSDELDDDDLDDDDEDDQDDAGREQERIKAERSGFTKGKRDTLRKLGFGTMKEARAALANLKDDGDSGENGDGGQPKPDPQPARDPRAERAVLSATVAKAVALAGVAPAKLDAAEALVSARLDIDDEPDESDIAEAIDKLRTQEPAWFAGSGEDDEDSDRGQGVPGPPRKRRQTTGSAPVAGKDAAIERLKSGGWS